MEASSKSTDTYSGISMPLALGIASSVATTIFAAVVSDHNYFDGRHTQFVAKRLGKAGSLLLMGISFLASSILLYRASCQKPAPGSSAGMSEEQIKQLIKAGIAEQLKLLNIKRSPEGNKSTGEEQDRTNTGYGAPTNRGSEQLRKSSTKDADYDL